MGEFAEKSMKFAEAAAYMYKDKTHCQWVGSVLQKILEA